MVAHDAREADPERPTLCEPPTAAYGPLQDIEPAQLTTSTAGDDPMGAPAELGPCHRCGQPGWKTLAAEVLCHTDYVNKTSRLPKREVPDPDLTADTHDGYRFTDAGNARRLVDLHGAELRHVSEWGRWLAWDGRRWVLDHGNAQVTESAKGVPRLILTGLTTATRSQREAVLRWATRSEMVAGIRGMIELAATRPDVRVSHTELDADPMLLNVANGTVDLVLGLLEKHDPPKLITKYVDVRFHKAAACPTWHAFLERVLPDPEVREFLQRMVGYSLTGSVDEQVMVFLIGTGANGKSVFLNVLRRLLGDYAVAAPRDLLIAQKHEPHPTSTARLHGARVAVASETEAGAKLAEAKVKDLTGGDQLTARRMREDFWQFTPTHKLWLASNHRPQIAGADEGIWRRLRVIPFDVTIPPAERDPGLITRLERELPGILAWAVEGCVQWQTYGLGLPAAVDVATSEYRAEQDVVGQFLTANGYTLHPGGAVPAGDLRRRYDAWAEAEGLHALGPVAWANALRSRGLQDVRRHAGRVWQGVAATTTREAT
ncbi:MAG: phage/plasmid primase, P4 family [Acidimicrobiia bacterium]